MASHHAFPSKVAPVLACLGGASRVARVNSGARILLPEGGDERVREAAKFVTLEGLANVEIITESPSEASTLQPFVEAYAATTSKFTQEEIAERLKDPLRFANLKVKLNQGSGVVAGCQRTTEDVVKAALEFLRVPKSRVSSFFLMIKDDRPFAFTDCGMNIAPNAEELASIAVQTVQSFRQLTADENPKAAFLSFSTSGSAKHDSLSHIKDALELAKSKDPDGLYDGELQFDAAMIPEVARKKSPLSPVAGNADILVFPDLNSGNIAYKVAERWGGAIAVGPILQGLACPSNDLSRGCDFEDIVNMILVTKMMSISPSSAATTGGARPRGKSRGLEQKTVHWKKNLRSS